MKWILSSIIVIFFIKICPAQEICNNGIDDDGDGLIDLNDVEDCICGIISTDVIGDFEEYSCCPTSYTTNLNDVGIECLNDGWEAANFLDGGADYYNTCGLLSRIPLPIPSGNGAIGIGTGSNSPGEAIGTCMNQSLLVGVNYDISFYVGFNDTLYGPPSNIYIASPLDFEFN